MSNFFFRLFIICESVKKGEKIIMINNTTSPYFGSRDEVLRGAGTAVKKYFTRPHTAIVRSTEQEPLVEMVKRLNKQGINTSRIITPHGRGPGKEKVFAYEVEGGPAGRFIDNAITRAKDTFYGLLFKESKPTVKPPTIGEKLAELLPERIKSRLAERKANTEFTSALI